MPALLTEQQRRPHEVREQCEPRKELLWQHPERQHFLNRCRDIVDYLFPHAGPIMGEPNSSAADARWRNIFDTCGTDALNVATAGLMTYATPPGGEWRTLVVRGEAKPHQVVKQWLGEVDDEMEGVFGQSNTYQALYRSYRNLLAFGQGCEIADYDEQFVMWCYPVPIGSFALAASFRGQIDTCYRELTMPLRAVVARWGKKALPKQLAQRWEKDKAKCWEHPVAIVQAIEPRPEQYQQSEESKQKREPQLSIEMPWRSVYWVKDTTKTEGLLSESGYEFFPVLAPRYDVVEDGVYGYGPGCMALSHIRSLQHRHFRLGTLIDWDTDPGLVLPTRMNGKPFGPGAREYADGGAEIQTVKPNGKADLLLADINDVRRQIRSAMGADVYSVISGLQGGNIREEHIRALVEEKRTILGPQTARSFDELPRPLVDLAYEYMWRAGRMPEPPPEVVDLAEGGKKVDVEFQGVLARSSAAFKRAANDQFLMGVAQYGEFYPSMRHKVREFDAANEIHETSGAAPNLLRSDEEAQQIANAEAAAKAQAEAIAQGAIQASAAKDAGTVKTNEPNLATAAMGIETE